jgi:glycosyltransferase involved in cell wall biosynthesis
MVVHGPYPVGEPRVARQTAAAIAAGYEVDVVAMRRTGEARCERVEGATVFRLPLAHRRGAGIVGLVKEYIGYTSLASARVAALHLRRHYDIVQIHNPPDFLVAAALLPKLLGARVLLDVHDLTPDIFAARFEGRPGATVVDRALRAVERAATGVADGVLTVHDPYRDELVTRGVPAEKVTVVMNSVDERLLPLHDDASTNGEFRIVYHGTVSPWYGVDRVVAALAQVLPRVPNAVLQIFGEGDGLDSVRRLATDLRVSDRVHISGHAHPQREVLELVRGASVGVVPNLPTRLNRFALSSKLFEYVAMGIPAVVSGLPTLRAHFAGDEVTFFTPDDERALAEALVAVAVDPAAASARADRARARYESYRWETNAARYVGLLDEMSARRSFAARESVA